MGDYINWFEKHFYHDSLLRGMWLTLSLLLLIMIVTFALSIMITHPLLLGILASMGIASKMLYESVKDIMIHPENIRFLVSRDTEHLSPSDINKAAIETYAENLSDGVIAPLFYLFFFGIVGLFLYKGINTLDSMVGYKNTRYEKFGKFSARLDDVANFIPARISALLIASLFFTKKVWKFYRYAPYHDSPNAGYPISAMALALGVKLGGDTLYFGVLKIKPYFGEGREEISKKAIQKALSLQPRLDILLISIFGVLLL
jgi:adenosylcobinamide-phosphate synthase